MKINHNLKTTQNYKDKKEILKEIKVMYRNYKGRRNQGMESTHTQIRSGWFEEEKEEYNMHFHECLYECICTLCTMNGAFGLS